MINNLNKSKIAEKQRIYLLAALEKAGTNPHALAKDLGLVNEAYIYEFTGNRKRSMKKHIWDQITDAIGVDILKQIADDNGQIYNVPSDKQTLQRINPYSVKVVGYVEAGVFREAQEPPEKYVNAMQNPNFPEAEQYALEIRGDSVNKLAREGDFACCIKFEDTGWPMQRAIGSFVVVETSRDQGSTVEYTVKKLDYKNDHYWLMPASDNPKHQPREVNGEMGEEIKISAIVSHFHINAMVML